MSDNNSPKGLTKLTKLDKKLIQDSERMKNCVCGHHVSWHWVDTHRNGRCVYHITELDACSCEKFIEGEGTENEMTLNEEN